VRALALLDSQTQHIQILEILTQHLMSLQLVKNKLYALLKDGLAPDDQNHLFVLDLEKINAYESYRKL
jgi:hypothetical protein